MNRFIYYLILVNMFANIVSTAPKVLLRHTTDGAIPAMVLGLIAGLLYTQVFIKFFNHFPGQNLPELLKSYTPKWYYYPTLSFFIIMWYLAGTLTLVTFTFMLATFLTPEMAIITMIIPYLMIISYGILMKSKNLLYATEVIFLLFLPIPFLTFSKAYFSSHLNWDVVKVAMMHSNTLPNFSSFTASFFTFAGISNLVIFNQYFTKKMKFGLKQVLIVGSISFIALFTTYFMPIGFSGFEHISSLLYPWISTTDSVRMKFGLIERLVFIFLLYFVVIAILSMTIHWHVSARLIQSIFHSNKLKVKNIDLIPFIIIIIFSSIAIFFSLTMTEYNLYKFASVVYNIMPLFFSLFLITMWLIMRGAKHEKS